MSKASADLLSGRYRNNPAARVIFDPDGTATHGLEGSFDLVNPLWYPRRSRRSMLADRGSYLTWRLGRTDRIAGVRALLRRARGHYQEDDPHDMVEYHAVRLGCDEQALAELLRLEFASVEILPYWSTPS